MIVVLYAAAIVVMWVLAWGSLTFANVLGGLVVAAVLVIVTPGRAGPSRRTNSAVPAGGGRPLRRIRARPDGAVQRVADA